MRIFARFEEQRRIEESAWIPSPSIEALILQVIGGWENLVGEVNWLHFDSVGPGGPPNDPRELATTARKVADGYGVRWPHDRFAQQCSTARQVRHKFAHFLYIYKVGGEYPNRVVAFIRLGEPRAPRKVGGLPSELSWRPPDYSMQTRHMDFVHEQQLQGALRDMKWMVECCSYLQRVGYFLTKMDPPWSDDYDLIHEQPFIPWWFDDWGDRRTAKLRARDLRA
jgi:hypothetical protein